MFFCTWRGMCIHYYNGICKQCCFSKEGYLTDVYHNRDTGRNYYFTINYLCGNISGKVKDICRQLAFLMKHDSNMLIHREFGLGGIGMLSDRLNDLLELRRKRNSTIRRKKLMIADTYTNLSHDIRTPLTSLDGISSLWKHVKMSKSRDVI